MAEICSKKFRNVDSDGEGAGVKYVVSLDIFHLFQ